MFYHEVIDHISEQLPFKLIIHKNASVSISQHWHRSFELSYTVCGSINSFIINGNEYHPVKGTILVVNPNEIHSVSGTTKVGEKNIAISLLIPYSLMKKVVSDFPHRFYEIPEKIGRTSKQADSYQKMQMAFNDLYLYSEKREPNFQIKLLSLVYLILYELTTHFSTLRPIQNDLIEPQYNENEWINAVINYIQNHYNKHLSVDELADLFHLTPSYFSRKFKKYMAMSVMEYVTEIRLQKATQEIMNTKKNIQYIADNCGFPNHKSLIQVFKKKHGKTPVEFRKTRKSHK